MKILKRTGLVLLVLVLIYFITAFFCKSQVHVERSLSINADAKTIFDNINTLKNWKSWSYWDNIDPNMVSTWEGPESGVGAVHHWTSQHDSVGNGSLTITQSIPSKFVETRLEFEGMGSSLGGWKLNDTAGAVTVTTYMDMEIPFIMRPVMAFMDMDKMLGPDFDKSLAGLKNVSESAPKETELKIEATSIEPMKVLTISDSCSSADISQKLGQLYGEIGAVMGKSGAKMTGPVFAIYHKVMTVPGGGMRFWLEAGVQIDKEVKSSGRVTYKVMPGGNVVRGDHYGSYESTGITHDKMHEWMSKNGKTIKGDPWESYVTDPMAEKDTLKWLTQIYYPVE